MRIAAFLNIIFTLFIINLSGQNTYPQNYFDAPIKDRIILTGNFGEIRPNHFHSGFDIKTNNKEGLSIFAIANGYVSRIKISPYGYGNALYITHPNGYTSIYAHLQSFNTLLDRYAKKIQYANTSFEVDTLLPANLFPVKKGDFIALSGNSGGSQGPHLHFEIRDTKTEKPINPHYFGFDIPDKIAPKIEKIIIYPLNDSTIINGKYEQLEITPKTENELQFIQPKDSIIAGGEIGIGVECYDTDDNSKNNNAVFSIELQCDGKKVYYHEMERFSFDNSRYVNAHIDYEAKQKNKGSIQKCFVAKNNEIEIYKILLNKGIICLNDGTEHSIQLIIKDYSGNSNELSFKIKSLLPTDMPLSFNNNQKQLPLNCLENNQFKKNDIQIEIPAKALYNDIVFNYNKSSNEKSKYSPIHHLHKNNTPLHKNMQLSIQTTAIPENLKNKAAIVLVNEKEKLIYCGGELKNEWITTETKMLGNYTIAVDTTSPVIKTVFIEPSSGVIELKKNRKLQFIITDNLSGIKNYSAAIDNKWTLLENDAKNNLFTLIIPTDLKSGYHDLFISISDDRGNRMTWECFIHQN